MVAYRRNVFLNVVQIVRRVGLLDARVEHQLALLGFSRTDRRRPR